MGKKMGKHEALRDTTWGRTRNERADLESTEEGESARNWDRIKVRVVTGSSVSSSQACSSFRRATAFVRVVVSRELRATLSRGGFVDGDDQPFATVVVFATGVCFCSSPGLSVLSICVSL